MAVKKIRTSFILSLPEMAVKKIRTSFILSLPEMAVKKIRTSFILSPGNGSKEDQNFICSLSRKWQ